MGRVTDFATLAVVILVLFVIQFAGAAGLDPVRTDLVEHGDMSNVNGEQAMNGMFEAVTFWVPLVGQIGSIVIVVWREFRRQRVTAPVPRGGGL